MRHASEYYHAHIYYEADTREKAVQLREKLASTFAGKAQVSRLVDRKVGPHPKPMFEVDFANPYHGELVRFLEQNRDGLDILVHENTDDEVWNHTEGASWLGKPQTLDIEWLRKYQDGQI